MTSFANVASLLLLLIFASYGNAFVVPYHRHTTRAPCTSPKQCGFSTTTATTTNIHRHLYHHRNDENDDVDHLGFASSFSSSTNHRQRRKRDFVKKAWGSTTSRLSIRTRRHSRHRHHQGATTTVLQGTNNNNDNNMNDADKEDNDNDESNNNSNDNKITTSIDKIWKEQVLTKLPQSVLDFFSMIYEKFVHLILNLRLALLSFAAGAVIMLGAILVPVYNQVESLAEPVTLFETILGDLERGYVDPVDTQKLFQTGVRAMLASLDPYTEFEDRQQAVELSESIGGKYAGVGLVISGANPRDIALMEAVERQQQNVGGDTKNDDAATEAAAVDDSDAKIVQSTSSPPMRSGSSTSAVDSNVNDDDDESNDDDDGLSLQDRLVQRKQVEKARERGVRVVSAFEGYAYDYGMRVGDKLLSIDDTDITPTTSVDQVRNMLRGEPGTQVTIAFEREGVDGIQTVTMPRTVVQIRDVKLATLVGNPQDGIGYIQLTGFSSNAGVEVRRSILALQRAAELAASSDGGGGSPRSSSSSSLKGLILDLRGNPGGLLTSAVDVSSLLVPKGSDIVSARGRGFPGVLYRSRVDPIVDASKTKLAVLVNGGTASAAEIVSGAVQDLDVGVIVGTDRTYGKGLVQNVEDLPFNTALKFTVAKYYTPSGRCIQGINYSEGDAAEDGGRFKQSKVADKDRGTFYTSRGREVKDGGGIEADYKVAAPQASALEVTLLRSGAIGEFAAQWSKSHELTNNFKIDDKTYSEFQSFVNQKQKDGDIELEAIYKKPIEDLRKYLKKSGYKGSAKELGSLQATIVREVQKDFDKYKADIKEDLQQSILARYLPESMLIEQGLKTDQQVQAAIKLVRNGRQFDRLLAKGTVAENRIDGVVAGSLNTASNSESTNDAGVRLKMKW